MAVVGLAALLAVGCGRDVPASLLVGADQVASDEREPAPRIAGTTLTGDPFDVADLRGSVVVVNAWASWCEPCRIEAADFAALSAGADPADVAVVGLNVTDEPAAAAAFVAEFDLPYPSIVDTDGAILRTIPGVPPSSLPSTVILDREGRIAARIIGGTDALELGTLIGQILEESPPASPAALAQ